MIVRESTAFFRRAGVAGVAPSLPPAQSAAAQRSRHATARGVPLAAGGLVTFGLLLAGWTAWHVPAGPHAGQARPAPAGVAPLAQPALRDIAPDTVPAAAAQPTGLAPALATDPSTLAAQHDAFLAAAGPATPTAVRTYLAGADRNLLSVQAGAITGAGKTELLLMGSGSGCASCHARWIAVWGVARQAPLWEADDGVDTVVAPVGDGLGFVRTDAVWTSTEPECCPAMWETSYLTWDGDTFAVRSVFNPLAELAGMPAPARP